MRFSKAKVRCSNALEAMSGIDGHQASYFYEDVNKARSDRIRVERRERLSGVHRI